MVLSALSLNATPMRAPQLYGTNFTTDYDANGNMTKNELNGLSSVNYKFTGDELYNETNLNLYHANAIGYNPVLGHF
jgi:hypothetical protein